LVPSTLRIKFVANAEWRKQNGVSVLAAAKYVKSPFLLAMSDHLFDQEIVDLLIERSVPGELNLAIDHKVGSVFDLADATKVRTSNGAIIDIGKHLENYDAIDTGLFVCPDAIFPYLESAKRNGDCSLSDGVRAMARDGKAHAIDIGAAWWQDVDTPEALLHATKHLAASTSRSCQGEAAKN
jgi:choline kinase